MDTRSPRSRCVAVARPGCASTTSMRRHRGSRRAESSRPATTTRGPRPSIAPSPYSIRFRGAEDERPEHTDCRASEPHRSIGRLLFVADAAVADVDELPPHVRAVIDEAAEIFVITPSLPGRLAWLADDVDRFRHVADERLDTVLGHLRSINAFASGDARRGSLLTVFADGVEEFEPDHVLLALRSPEHANWQGHSLVTRRAAFRAACRVLRRGPSGFASSANGPMLLCYDGSADARNAIERAGTCSPAARSRGDGVAADASHGRYGVVGDIG